MRDAPALINPPADALGPRNAIISWTGAKHLHNVVAPRSDGLSRPAVKRGFRKNREA